MSGTFRLADLAAARNRQVAPQGPPQATTLVRGQPHMMAYITPDEAYILRNRGGGLAGGSRDLQLEQSGIPAFADAEGGSGNDGNDRGGGGNDGGGGGSGGGGSGGNDVNAGDTRGSDVGDRAGSPSTGASGASDVYGNDPYGGVYDTRGSDVADRAGSPSTGESGASDNYGGGGDMGFFGGVANYGGGGGGGGASDGGGGSEGGTSSGYDHTVYNPAFGPQAPVAPPGPTPEELAEKERLRLLALDDEAERRVRAKYDKSVGATWRTALAEKFNTDATGLLTEAYGTTRAGLLNALKDSGYIATPLATARVAGLDKQKEGETSKIPGIQNTRLGDYDARRNTSLVDAIKRARAGHDPDAADLLADASIEQLNSSISTNPGAAYTPSFSVDSGIITPTESAVQTSAADNFRNALLQVRDPAAAARVA